MIQCPRCGEDNPPKFRLCGYCGAQLQTPSVVKRMREVRKTVTIVFSDLEQSTSLGERVDQETLHEAKQRYFTAMSDEIRSHGGKIEKYVGDAIMAVFGLPRAHEDDALRAVRASVGMQLALTRVNADLTARFGITLRSRTGVNTGVVVADEDPAADQRLATGDAVNVAARLEQAAPADQIYLGESTYHLVRDAVEAEPIPALQLKGRTASSLAFRLIRLRGHEEAPRVRDAPLVGRDEELSALLALFHEAAEQRAARMATVIGDAGAGKSRLVRELVARVATQARVLTGRCLSYGNGITYWPLAMMIRDAAEIHAQDSPAVAQRKLLASIEVPAIADRLASAIGFNSSPHPLHEVNWATRKFLERMASRGPLVVVLEDIHWAEPAFLELLDHVLQTAADAPILLLATARAELVEERPQWGAQPNSLRIMLRPLSAEATTSVVVNLRGPAQLPLEIVARIVRLADGNPLYAEQTLRMLMETGALRFERDRWVNNDAEGNLPVPPSIQALLEARLDRLSQPERAVLELASIIGLEFEEPAVDALASDLPRGRVAAGLDELCRKGFLHAVKPEMSESGYRFHHQVLRDTVYHGILKRARADLHVQFVHWVDQANARSDRALEFEEILGYHLEQAHRYLRELGLRDARVDAVGQDAARRLSAAGRRVFARGDMHAAVNLYRRAASLLEERDSTRPSLLTELGEALVELGDFAEARAALVAAEAAAGAQGAKRVQLAARLHTIRARLFSEATSDAGEEALRVADEAIAFFEREAAHAELARAWRLIGFVHGAACRYAKSEEAVRRSTVHARMAGDRRLIARNAMGLSLSAALGATPVPRAIEQCQELLADAQVDRQAESKLLCTLATLHAMNGEFDKARAYYRRGRGTIRDLRPGVNAASTAIDVVAVEFLAGDLAAAEREARPDYEFLCGIGETYTLSTLAAVLARVVRNQGRDAEALSLTEVAEQATASDDVESQALWRSIRAPILARAGRRIEAEELSRSAVELSQRTDATLLRADVLTELATVLSSSGRSIEAGTVLKQAVALYDAKGDVVSALRSRRRADYMSDES